MSKHFYWDLDFIIHVESLWVISSARCYRFSSLTIWDAAINQLSFWKINLQTKYFHLV